MATTENLVSKLSDLSPVPLRLSVNDGLCTIYMNHIMVTQNLKNDYCSEGCPQTTTEPVDAETRRMSRVLHLLLPHPTLCAAKAERLYLNLCNINSNILQRLPEHHRKDTNYNTYLTGSKGESLDLPLTFSISKDHAIQSISKSDLDLLVIVTIAESETNQIVDDTDDVHPGFFRCFGKETLFACGVSEFVNQQAQLMGQIHGPSILSNTPMKQVDHVIGFRFHGWPKNEDAFRHRKRPSGWPSEGFVEDIIQDGCHMVFISHPFTDITIRNEWRFSFSLAEKKMALSLTVSQRFVFTCLKLLHHHYFANPNELSSYHMKTLLFWECENVQAKSWGSGNEALRLVVLIECLLKCLQQRNLPSYFIPANNLIDHIPAKRIDYLIGVVSKVKDDPLGCIANILKNNRFLGYPIGLQESMIKEIADFADITVESYIYLAVKCASVHVADFYLTEKVIKDTTLFFMQPGEGLLAGHLIKAYYQNMMIPLQSALFILQQALCEDTPKNTISQSTQEKKMFECLTNVYQGISIEGLKMTEDEDINTLVQKFISHELPAIQSALTELDVLLANDNFFIGPQETAGSSNLATSWGILLRLVSYCFIILHSRDAKTTEKYLMEIKIVQLRLEPYTSLVELLKCSQQLFAFSLCTLGRYPEVEQFLKHTELSPKAKGWLRKLMKGHQASSPSTGSVLGKFAWECVSLTKHPRLNKDDNDSFSLTNDLAQREQTFGTALDPEAEFEPVGRIYGIYDRRYWDSCMMRYEVDTAQNFLVPKDNLLQQSLRSMAEETADEGMETLKHPSCIMIVAKYLLLNKETDKAIALLEQVIADPRSVLDCYRIFPLEVRIMLDDRVLAGEKLRVRDHFDFSVIQYSLFLLVRAYKDKGCEEKARKLSTEMADLCEKDCNGTLGCSYPWQVSANNLTLTATTMNLCRNNGDCLKAFIFAELLSRSTKPWAADSWRFDFGKTITSSEAFREVLTIVSEQLNLQSADALRMCLEVLYPEVDLRTALRRLNEYCNDDNTSWWNPPAGVISSQQRLPISAVKCNQTTL